MAKLLFDANGVSPKYQSDSHILLRALLSKYNALTDIKYHITDKKEKENNEYIKINLIKNKSSF